MSETYPVPLYLQQAYVLDILAMMEDGFAELHDVRTTQSKQDDVTSSLSAGLGVRNVLALLDISLGGGRQRSAGSGEQSERHEQRVHTINSLFAKMRNTLASKKLIHPLELSSAPGQFVEFRARLRKNPMVDLLETIISLMNTSTKLTAPQAKNDRQSNRSDRQTLEQLTGISRALSGEGAIDLLGDVIDSDITRAVLTLDPRFLSDPSLSDMVDGEYMVLGKVTKVLKDEASEPINLLRKTPLGNVKIEQFLGPLAEAMQTPEANDMLVLPTLEVTIAGPAAQVIPIGIFI